MFKFDIDSCVANPLSYKIGEKYDFYDNVLNIQIDKSENFLYHVDATVDVLGNLFHCYIECDEFGEIYDYGCECQWCDDNSPCAHIAAVLLKLNELEVDHIPFEYTSQKEEREKRRRNDFFRELQRREREMRVYKSRRTIEQSKKYYQNQLLSLVSHETYELYPYFVGHDHYISFE